MKAQERNLFVSGIKYLQKVAVATLCLVFILTLTTTKMYSQSMSIDYSFGNEGLTTIPNTTEHFFINFDHNGNIITAGYSLGQEGEAGLEYISIAKTNPNGIIDESFGTNGLMRLTQYPNARVIEFKITNDNKILLFVAFGTETIITQINQNGTIDADFGNNGKIIVNINPSNILSGTLNAEHNDYILVGKKTTPQEGEEIQFTIVKYNNFGEIIASFGEVSLNYETFKIVPQAIKILKDQSIIVAGYAIFNNDYHKELAFCKLTANGQLVSNFANNGIWTKDVFEDFDLMHELFNNIFIDKFDNILLSSNMLSICSFNKDGIINEDFGENGFCNVYDLSFSLGIFQNGDDYILGSMNKIVSINNDGTINEDFNENGYFYFENYTFRTMILQNTNKVIFGGRYNGNFTLMRANVMAKSGGGDNPTSINPNEISNTISIYPNPVKDNLYFNEAKQIEVIDIQGKVLLKTEKAVKSLNVSNLSSGIYFVKTLSCEGTNQTQKFVKSCKINNV